MLIIRLARSAVIRRPLSTRTYATNVIGATASRADTPSGLANARRSVRAATIRPAPPMNAITF